MRKFLIFICIFLMLFCIPIVKAEDITGTGMSQRALVKFLENIVTIVNELKSDFNILRDNFLNKTTTSGIMSFGSGESSGKTTSTANYAIGGKLYTFSASSNIRFIPQTAQSTPTYCYYLFSLNSSGVLTTTKGTEGSSTPSLVMPAVPANTAPIAAVLIYASSTAFQLGVSSTSTAVITTPTWYQLVGPISGTSFSTAISASDLALTGL